MATHGMDRVGKGAWPRKREADRFAEPAIGPMDPTGSPTPISLRSP